MHIICIGEPDAAVTNHTVMASFDNIVYIMVTVSTQIIHTHKAKLERRVSSPAHAMINVVRPCTSVCQGSMSFMPKYGSDCSLLFTFLAFLHWEQMNQCRSQIPLEMAQPACMTKRDTYTRNICIVLVL